MRVQALEEAAQMVPCMVLRVAESVQRREEHSMEVCGGACEMATGCDLFWSFASPAVFGGRTKV